MNSWLLSPDRYSPPGKYVRTNILPVYSIRISVLLRNSRPEIPAPVCCPNRFLNPLYCFCMENIPITIFKVRCSSKNAVPASTLKFQIHLRDFSLNVSRGKHTIPFRVQQSRHRGHRFSSVAVPTSPQIPKMTCNNTPVSILPHSQFTMFKLFPTLVFPQT